MVAAVLKMQLEVHFSLSLRKNEINDSLAKNPWKDRSNYNFYPILKAVLLFYFLFCLMEYN